MKKLVALLCISLIWSCKEAPKEPSIAETLQTYTIAQMMDNESVFGGSFSPDNSKLMVSSNRTGINNVYEVNTATGEFMPVTESDSSSIYAISYFPNDRRMLFDMDDNGDEIYQIFLRDTTGVITNLTPDEGARANFYGWSKDEKSFYFGSNKRNPQFQDIYKMDIATFTSTLMYQNDEGYDVSEISDDEGYLALVKPINTNDTDLYLYSMADQKMTKINENQSGNSAEDFSKDGEYLYYTTNDGGEFMYLKRYNIAEGTSENVLEKEWDIMGSYFTRHGKYRVTYVNEDAKNVIEIFDTEAQQNIDLPQFDGGDITSVGFSRDENMMRFYVGSSNSPSNLYAYDLESETQTKLTEVLNDEIVPQHLVKAEVVRFNSFDGVEIPAIYYQPHQASEENPVPALVWVHGGPGGQSRQNFSALIQYMVNHGYAVLAVNNRGSSGYGKTFFQMDDLNHGDKDLRDCIEGKNWLMQQPNIDADKIGIIGGSYGGYMTMAALTFAPEEFDVGVNIFGVTNWIRTLKSIPPWWESFKDALYKELGDPYSADSVRLKQISPLFHANKVTKPLIVLQGAQDPRVLQVESDEIVASVRKNGVPVEYVLFDDEGHGFQKKENQIEAYGKILEFLDVHLKGEVGEPIKDGDI